MEPSMLDPQMAAGVDNRILLLLIGVSTARLGQLRPVQHALHPPKPDLPVCKQAPSIAKSQGLQLSSIDGQRGAPPTCDAR